MLQFCCCFVPPQNMHICCWRVELMHISSFVSSVCSIFQSYDVPLIFNLKHYIYVWSLSFLTLCFLSLFAFHQFRLGHRTCRITGDVFFRSWFIYTVQCHWSFFKKYIFFFVAIVAVDAVSSSFFFCCCVSVYLIVVFLGLFRSPVDQ